MNMNLLKSLLCLVVSIGAPVGSTNAKFRRRGVRRSAMVLLALSMAAGWLLPVSTAGAATSTITICSQQDHFYNILGDNAQSLRDKLENPVNFGPAGSYGDFDFDYINVGANFTEASIVSNSCNIWYSGFERDDFYTASELIELQNWVANNDGQVMAGCDDSTHDPVCDLLDFTVTTDTDTFGYIVDQTLNPLTCDGLLDASDLLIMAGGIGGYFSGPAVTSDNVLAVHETGGVADITKPIIVYTGNFFLTSDINMIQTGETALTLSDGPGVITNNDIMTMNAMSSLADASIGNPVCTSVVLAIDLEPRDATNFLGELHELTATITTDDPEPGTPVVGTVVDFTVLDGPHIGTVGEDTTDADGVATFSYVGTTVGTDTIEATYVDAEGNTRRSNQVTKTWEERPIEIDLNPDVATNDLGTEPNHTVTATVLLGGLPFEGAVVDFSVVGVSGLLGPTGMVTDSAGEASYTYPGAALGFDSITGCVEIDVCDEVEKEWVDVTPPAVECNEGPNPSGRVPRAPGKGGKGQNQDGFYTILADDLVDLYPEVFVVDTGTGFVFGPFASGTNIKYVEDDDAAPNQEPGPGVVDWKLKGQGDAAVYAVDASGNISDEVACLVPPHPQ